jgi:hypothetical protein
MPLLRKMSLRARRELLTCGLIDQVVCHDVKDRLDFKPPSMTYPDGSCNVLDACMRVMSNLPRPASDCTFEDFDPAWIQPVEESVGDEPKK